MLNKNKILNVLFLALIFSLGAVAQNTKTESNSEEGYKQGGWWTLGINAGSSYQTSDVCNTYEGWGVGLTLAKNLYYRPGAPLTFDLRGRFLYANQKGQDWERSYGVENNIALNGTDDRDFFFQTPLNYNTPAQDSFYIANYRNDLAELGLEGVFNLNRLKERTNVIVNLYGGINLDWYKTRINQAKDDGFLSGTEYDYSNIPTDKSSALALLESTSDNTYETVGDGFKNEYGTFAIMPSAGFELGYQITPKFSIIGGHKVTWSMDDKMDGQRWNNDNTLSTNNDLYHYTHLGLRWVIDPHEHTMDPPIINIIRPTPLPHATQVAYVTVKAEIENVSSAADVNCTFNGNNYNSFSFNPRSEDFISSLNLIPGRNELIITATNMVGQDTENVIIIYNAPTTAPTPNKTPPVVKITRPSKSGTTVKNASYNLGANVNHVDSRSNIKVSLNGSSVGNFSYSFNTDKLDAALTLQPGKNIIKVTGTNNDGSDSDQTVIIYEEEEAPCPDPVVSINNISTAKATTNPNIAKSTVNAIVKNVKSKSEIRMYVNGDRTTDFSYNPSNGSLTATINVGTGRNEVKIVATTDCGKDEDKENVTYNASTPTPNPTPIPTPTPNPVQPPIVDISTPNNGITVSSATIKLVATVKHVTGRNNIRMTLNGINYNNFSYNVNTKVLNANNIPIRLGTNTIEVKATNNAGTDSDDVLVIRENNTPTPTPTPAPCPKPTVRIDNITAPAPMLMNPDRAKSTLYATTQNVTSKNQIELYINGTKKTNFTFNASTKKIVLNFETKQGNNTVKVVVTTNCGTAQDSGNIVFEVATTPTPAPCPKPTAKIDNITDPAPMLMNPNKAKSTLYATTTNVSSKNQVEVYINGSKNTSFNFNTSTGKIVLNFETRPGNNTLKLVVKTNCGTAQDSDNIAFVVATTPKPVVNIVKPTNNATFSVPSTSLSATVLNVTSKSDITIKVNGSNVNNFNFNANNNSVLAPIALQEGNNTIVVTASNSGGSDSDTKTVKYVKPSQPKPPVVNITKPANNSTQKISAATLKATILNVTSKNNVTVKLNGIKVNNFTLSGTNLIAPLTLKGGKNTIIVKATNSDGQDQASVSVTYQQALKPTVKITKPVGTPTVSVPAFGLKATLTNVTAKKDVTVLLNGKNVGNFTYTPRGGKLSAPLTLKPGKNIIVVKGKNAAGAASDTKTIIFKARTPSPTVKKPTVKIDNITTPAPMLMNPNMAKCTLYATTTGISSKSEIKVYVNGKAFTAFSFDKNQKRIVANIQLEKGTSTLKVVVQNTTGKAEDTDSITF